MSLGIPAKILCLSGQRVNHIQLEQESQQVVIRCKRDRRRKAVDPISGKQGPINRYIRREIRDIPLFGYPCIIEIELAQVFSGKNERRIEQCEFVDKGSRFTHRFCRMISGFVPSYEHTSRIHSPGVTLGNGKKYRQSLLGGNTAGP